MQVWRLQTKPSSGNNIDYCLKNQIAAIGWSLGELSREEREECRDFSVYLARAKEIYKGDSLKTCLSCVTALHDRIKPGDYIWMRSGRTFYLARVDEQSEWRFCPDEEATRLDSCNQLTNLRWYPYGKIESDIPGALYTAFIRGKTVQRIGKSGIETFTALLYDRLAGTHFADGRTVEQAEETFYTLLSPSDCEDLLCLWLYKTYGYVCIPSTCKISTKLYECELINPENGGRIFVQAKNSGDVIDAAPYAALPGEVWFLTTKGTVADAGRYPQMHIAAPAELYAFALSEDASRLLPDSIKTWLELLRAGWKR